ncbi:VgrG protein [Minicystis rosea]|nr:VgrG protein [Minicystis rosea]
MAIAPFAPPRAGRIFELAVDAELTEPLEVVAFSGDEAVSEVGAYTLEVATHESADAVVSELVGAAAALRVRTESGKPRRFSGFVRAAEAIGWGGATDPQGARVQIELRPHLSLLAETRSCRVFQDRSVIDIARALLDAWSIPHRVSLAHVHAPWPYCVQYQESDLAFLQRILAAEGVFFFLVHDEAAGQPFGAATVVLGDGPGAFSSFDDAQRGAPFGTILPVSLEESALVAPGESIHRLGRRVVVAPTSVELRDYNPLNAALDIVQRASIAPGAVRSAGANRLSVYEFLPPAPLAPGGGRDEAAAVALEQHRGGALTIRGKTSSPRVVPGHGFVVVDHPEPGLSGPFVATRIRATGRVAHYGAEASRPSFELEFAALPEGAVPRPPRPPWAPRDTLDTAEVIGPDESGATGQDIFTDSLGRIRVRFHWGVDRPGLEAQSCWLRVLQPWSGAGFGVHFTPRVGTEVLVGFLGGDVNRPVVMGAVPNSATPPPFHLPAEKTKSGIVTRSSPHGSPGGDGRNELVFDDAAGREQVLVRAQRDMETQVIRDQSTRVQRDARVEVDRDLAVTVRRSSTKDVAGDATRTVAGRSVDTIAGDRTVRIGGASIETFESAHVTIERSDASREVHGARRDRFRGASQIVFEAETVERHEAGGVVIVGTPSAPASYTHLSEGDTAIESRRTIELVADQSVRIVCGDSALVITPDCVQIRSPRIRLEGDVLESHGDRVNVLATKTVRLEGEKIFAKSGGASLGLTRDAKIDGAMVKLKSPPDASDGPEARVAFPPPTTVRLVDQDGEPLAGARFVVTRADGSRRAGRLDENGEGVVLGLDGSAEIAFPDHASWEEG